LGANEVATANARQAVEEAAILAAANWGTYVMAHVSAAPAIKRCIKAGARSIKHSNIADEEAVKMMADDGTVWPLRSSVEENATRRTIRAAAASR
jgi:imidazolonepropionase-like amidohydrolase